MSQLHPAQAAVNAYWKARRDAEEAKANAGRADTGKRGAVTAGQHLVELEAIVINEFINAGVDPKDIRQKSGIQLPGYYRPAKKWDVVVIEEDVLVAAIEFKSQVGPSFGNNVNNRTEEALGSAADVWRAYQEGTFGAVRPWLGYFFILEETRKSTEPVGLPRGMPFPPEEAFAGTSYKDRYRILCERMVRERLYDAACFLTATDEAISVIHEPDPELGFASFAAAIAGRVAGIHAQREARYPYILGSDGLDASQPRV